MAELLKKMVDAAQTFVRRLKAPWRITGPASSPEFKDPIPDVLSYRTFSPATPLHPPSIPQALPERVYDIAYFTRDTRRDIRPRKVQVQDAQTLLQDPDLERLKPSPPVYVMGRLVSVSDVKNDGYQK